METNFTAFADMGISKIRRWSLDLLRLDSPTFGQCNSKTRLR